MNPLVLWAVVISILAGIAFGAAAWVILWHNAGSKNLSLAVAALFGVLIAFLVQLRFELSGEPPTYETIGTDLTIDRSKPSIRQWKYNPNSPTTGWRIGVETTASDWAAKNHIDSFNERDKLTKDLAIFSLLSFLTHVECDWELQRQTFKSMTSGNVTTTMSRPKPIPRANECRTYAASELKERLIKSGNILAAAPLTLISGRLCLPPHTELEISGDALSLQNPISAITFKLVEGPTMFVNPNGGDFVELPNGESQFETRQIGIEVTTAFTSLRPQDRDHKKYENWARRVVDGARTWFEN